MQRDRGSNLCSRNRVRLQVRVEEKHLTEIKTQSYLNQGKRNDCVPFTRQSQNLENRNYPQRLSYRLKKKQGGNYSRCMSRFHHHTAEIRSKKTPRITSFAVFMIRSLSSWKKKIFFLQTLPLWTKNSTPVLEAWIQRPYVCGQRWRNNISRQTEGKLLFFNEKKKQVIFKSTTLKQLKVSYTQYLKIFPLKILPVLVRKLPCIRVRFFVRRLIDKLLLPNAPW